MLNYPKKDVKEREGKRKEKEEDIFKDNFTFL